MQNFTSTIVFFFSLIIVPLSANCQYFTQAWDVANNTRAEGYNATIGEVNTSVSLETTVNHSFSVKDIFERAGADRKALYFKALDGFKNGEKATITISFDQEVHDLCFELYDIDQKEDHQDVVQIEASKNGVAVDLATSDLGLSVSALDKDVFAGIAQSSFTETKGDIMVCLNEPVDKVSISYADLMNNGAYQVFGIGKFNWHVPSNFASNDQVGEMNSISASMDSEQIRF